MITKILCLFATLCCLTLNTPEAHAASCQIMQPQPPDAPNNRPPRKFNPEQFRRDLTEYITKAAGFTPAEARTFFPLFFEMREKQRNLEHQKGRALRHAAEHNMNEYDCQRVLAEVAELQKKSLRIEQQYCTRLRKIVGARKLVKAISAERAFGRKAFKRMTK